MPSTSSSSVASPQSESTLKDRLIAAREHLTAETQRAYGGISTVKAYASEIDVLVHEIYRDARKIESNPVA